MNDQDNKSRFAELAVELMGSKMVAEFVRDIWANASPEVKRELADKVLAKVGKDLAEESLFTQKHEVLHEAVRRCAAEHLAAVKERLDAEVKKIMAGDLVETEVRKICDNFVRTAARAACREAASQIR